MLYNVIFIQALVSTSCKFTAEEREAWRKKGRPVSGSILYARQNLEETYYGIQMSGVCPSVCLFGIHMLRRNLRTTNSHIIKLYIVVSYDGQTMCILFGENEILTF